jgi:hypothetical protein
MKDGCVTRVSALVNGDSPLEGDIIVIGSPGVDAVDTLRRGDAVSDGSGETEAEGRVGTPPGSFCRDMLNVSMCSGHQNINKMMTPLSDSGFHEKTSQVEHNHGAAVPNKSPK